MPKTRRKKSDSQTFSSDHVVMEESEKDAQVAMENATEQVIATLPQGEQKKQRQRSWGNRPEHLRKAQSEFTQQDELDYHVWRANELAPEGKKVRLASETPDVQEQYTPEDFFLLVMGSNLFIRKRFGDFYALDSEEMQMFCKALVPIANKFMALPDWALVFKPLIAFAGAYTSKRVLMKVFSNVANNLDSRDSGNGQDNANSPGIAQNQADVGHFSV